jgi:hypothetical protein
MRRTGEFKVCFAAVMTCIVDGFPLKKLSTKYL